MYVHAHEIEVVGLMGSFLNFKGVCEGCVVWCCMRGICLGFPCLKAEEF